MNTCKCGGEVFLDYRQGYYTGQHWYAICGDCGNEIPLNANNRIDAIREWNNMQVDEPQEQTNEEWFCSLPTKNKAEVLNRMTTACYVCGQDGVDFKRCPFGMDCTGQEDIEDWLKQKHIDIREE